MAFLSVLICLTTFIIVNSATPGGIVEYALGGFDKQCRQGIIANKCANCTHLRLCFGNSEPGGHVDCASVAPDSPYCVNGACSSDPDFTDTTCKRPYKFMCTNSGFMPDPLDCGTFHHCKSAGAKPSTYICPTDYVFDVEREKCVPSSGDYECSRRTMTCTPDAQFALYSLNEAYYSACKENVVFRCEDTVNERFDQTVKGCVPYCKEEKTFADPKSASNYYQCMRRYGYWEPEIKTCPHDTKYNPIVGACTAAFM